MLPKSDLGYIGFELSVRPSPCPSVRPSVHVSFPQNLIQVRSISPILFEVEIQSSIYGYTLGSRSVAYYFRAHVTLTSGLKSRKACLLGAFVTL